MSHLVTGLVPILATPFHADGTLDIPSLRRMTEFALQSGVTGVAVSGMASEAFALTTPERQHVLREVVRVVDQSVPVVAGVNGTSTATAIEQAVSAQEDGAQCLMVLPPFMVKPAPTQIIDFYAAVADAVDIEIMVQDAPGPSGVQMSTEMIAKLSQISGVTSVKVEAPPTAPKTGAVAEVVDTSQFGLLGGNNAQFCLEEYAQGAIGTMPACEFVDLLNPILQSWEAGNHAEARQEFARLLPMVLAGLQPGLAWSVHKEILVRRGIIENSTVRPPARPLDQRTRVALHEMLDALPFQI